jgi:hypothetical protein
MDGTNVTAKEIDGGTGNLSALLPLVVGMQKKVLKKRLHSNMRE